MSQVSERRLKALGDGLRSIEGYGGATVKLVGVKSAEKIQRITALRRKTGVSDMVAIVAKSEPAVKSSAVVVKPARSGSSTNRWVLQKFLIDAVFV